MSALYTFGFIFTILLFVAIELGDQLAFKRMGITMSPWFKGANSFLNAFMASAITLLIITIMTR